MKDKANDFSFVMQLLNSALGSYNQWKIRIIDTKETLTLKEIPIYQVFSVGKINQYWKIISTLFQEFYRNKCLDFESYCFCIRNEKKNTARFMITSRVLE